MAILTTDILFKFSEGTGPGNTNAGTGPTSLGGWISTTALTHALLNDLWDDVSSAEDAASDVEYRCIFVHNAHATLTLTAPYLWLSAEVAGGASFALALDGIAASPIGQVGAQAEEEADESTPPTGETFTSPTTKGAGIAVGDLVAGYCRGIWVRRTAANNGPVSNDGATIRVEGETAA